MQAIEKGAPLWPHVESNGSLCLKTTQFSADAGQRVLTMLQHAQDVLSMDEEERNSDFERELLSYWWRGQSTPAPDAICLLDPIQDDREIVYWRSPSGGIVFAENTERLTGWVGNLGERPPSRFDHAALGWLVRPLRPGEYPRNGEELMQLVGRERVEPHLRAGVESPVVLGCMMDAGPVFLGVNLTGPSLAFAQRGFRPSKGRPQHLLADLFRKLPVKRYTIQRADASWVHGRDRNESLSAVQDKSVAVVGCGAIGGFLARNLAQAGVGSLILIDHDELAPTNVGRHVLGMEWATCRKATALASQIKKEFPHIASATPHALRFQDLKPDVLDSLASCDLLILAGVDLDGELAVDRWRNGLENPPAIVWTWVEEFALAGHAVALFGGDGIAEGLDAEGRFRHRLTTNWPKGTGRAIEAGCGVAFQPYSCVDMMGTVTLASRLAVDILVGKLDRSVVRSWLGNREEALALGCEPAPAFNGSYCEITRAWVP